MEINPSGFYEILSPRCAVLISTVDKEGRANAAPFSFVTPVSSNPPLVLYAAAPHRHTLANTRETGDFVLNIVPEGLLDKLIGRREMTEGPVRFQPSNLDSRYWSY